MGLEMADERRQSSFTPQYNKVRKILAWLILSVKFLCEDYLRTFLLEHKNTCLLLEY